MSDIASVKALLAAWLVEEPGRYYERSRSYDEQRIYLYSYGDIIARSPDYADESTAILSALERAKGGR